MGCAEPIGIDVRIGSRTAERVPVWAPVEAVHHAGTVLTCLHDLSVSGARIEAIQHRIQVGDIVRLRLPLLPVERTAEVVWIRGRYLGVEFVQLLDRATFELLATAAKPPADYELEPIGLHPIPRTSADHAFRMEGRN